MSSEEISIKCIQSFHLESLSNYRDKEGPLIQKNKIGVAIKHLIDNNKYFYSCDIGGWMFDMKENSFNKYMVEL